MRPPLKTLYEAFSPSDHWLRAPKPALDHLGVSYEPLAKWYTESM